MRDSRVRREEMMERGEHVAALIEAEVALLAGVVPGRLAGADEARLRERLEDRFSELVKPARDALENAGWNREDHRRTHVSISY